MQGRNRPVAATPLLFARGGVAFAEPQEDLRRFERAISVFWAELYTDAFEELHCGRTIAARANHNVEHLFPAFWMTKAIGCGTRKTCRPTSEHFNRMEADLHNLYPTRIRASSVRGSLPRDEVPGEDHNFPEAIESSCLESTSGHFRQPIDFIVPVEQGATWVDVASFRIVDVDAANKLERRQISDRCPVVIDLVNPTSAT